MAKDRAQQIIERGDPREIIRIALEARNQAEEGIFCECEEPILHGFDLMCGRCLRENQSQIDRRNERIQSSHAFEAMGHRGIKALMCRVCSGWQDDPRHASPPSKSGGDH
jgi:hypothetical protein